MFDIGWTEILVLATISLFIIGPKDIPKFLGYIGKFIGKIRGMTTEFKETVDDAIKDSELEDIKKEIAFNEPDISSSINDIINPNNIINKENQNESTIQGSEKNIQEKQDSLTDKQDTTINKNLSSEESLNNENAAGPTEKLPSGLKHIREKSKG